MSEDLTPKLGDLRGLGLRLDPQGILIASESKYGLTWGYTIVDSTVVPAVYTADGWLEFVHESVWNDIKDQWNSIKTEVKNNPSAYKEYLEYSELN